MRDAATTPDEWCERANPPAGRVGPVDDSQAALLRLAHRPVMFLLPRLRRRAPAHAVVLASVLAAVACAVGTNWAVKGLVDAVAAGPGGAGSAAVWRAFAVL